MVSIEIVDREGESRNLQVDSGLTIMEVLRDNGFEVDGTCGGMAYCASCHVYVDEETRANLTPANDTEVLTVEGLVHAGVDSRLGCQIVVSEDLEGIRFTLAPAEI